MDDRILTALRKLVPLNSLTEENLRTLAQAIAVQPLDRGTVFFREGDLDNVAVYLLEGEITLSSSQSSIGRDIAAGSEESRYALAQLKPRQYTGTAKDDVVITKVDSMLLDRLLTWEQATGYEVAELDAGTEQTNREWMMGLLRSEVFQRLPTENINNLFAQMEPVDVKAGQVIIRQGDPGDYYYIIKQGQAIVSRKSDETGKVVLLAELGEASGFGEEALLSGAPRNATIVMKTDGVLMRLGKQAFDALLKAPLVKWVKEKEAKAMIREGVGLIDVRLEDEHGNSHLRNAVNIPLYMLRLKARGLDPRRKYLIYCQTGTRSASAAFLLMQRGFDVYVLQGGYQGLRRVQD